MQILQYNPIYYLWKYINLYIEQWKYAWELINIRDILVPIFFIHYFYFFLFYKRIHKMYWYTNNCVALTCGHACWLIHGMLHDWFIFHSDGSYPAWNFQYNVESGLANKKKRLFPIDCNWLMKLLGVDLEGLNTRMSSLCFDLRLITKKFK